LRRVLSGHPWRQAIASGVTGKLACTNHVKIDRPDKPPRSNFQAKSRFVVATENEFAVMQHPRLYPRQRPQGRLSSVAKIFFEQKAAKAPVIECILVDYSAGGACLQLDKFVALPERFEVLYGTTRKRCRVVWKRGLRIGVVF
jgi:hypothetical protein